MLPAGVDGFAAPQRVAAGDYVSGDENNSAQDDHEQKGADPAGRGHGSAAPPSRRCSATTSTRRDVRPDWFRFAVRHTQVDVGVQDTNPRDKQDSAYLVDADLFLSADKRLIRVLTAVRVQAPFDVAAPRLVKPAWARSRVEAVIETLE
jgi:hypothetical protein